MKISTVHDSLLNGQRRQMVEQIDEYGYEYDFWKDYSNFLKSLYVDIDACYQYFEDATVSYFRIKGR